MVNVDTVYQKVLALCNKEQRGYMTPQEFNLLADKAQLELFDHYFHDIKTGVTKQTNQQGVAFDETEMILEKLHPFHEEVNVTQVADDATYTLPNDLYYINVLSTANGEITEMTRKEIMHVENNPLLQATTNRMNYVREEGAVRLYPTPIVATVISLHYWKRPTSPEWSYVVVNKRALYNANNSTNFTLHASEEEFLVARILQLAGIVIMKPGIVEIGAAEISGKKVQQNN